MGNKENAVSTVSCDSQSVAFLRSIIDALPNELMVIDADYSVLFANRTVRERLGDDDPIENRRLCYQINHHRKKPCTESEDKCLLSRVFREASSVTENHHHLDDFGNEVLMEVTGVPIFDSHGKVTHMLEISRAVNTAKLETQRHLGKQTQSLKLESLGMLASSIAHDFNNLMIDVQGRADSALETVDTDALVRPHLLSIIDSANRASELAGQMLAYSEKGQFIDEALSFIDLFEEMRSEIETLIPKHIILKYDFNGDVPPIAADRSQIRRIILNLLTNSAEAVGNNAGVISIGTGVTEYDKQSIDDAPVRLDIEAGTYAYLEVCDNGDGMDQETMSKMFDPFFSTKRQGRGVGLTTVLGIVRSQKGAIDVFSERGEGTTFRVLFPAAVHHKSVNSDTSPIINVSREEQTVLIIDDEAAILNVAKQMLEFGGFRVIAALSAREALTLFQRQRGQIDCIILDLSMPEMGGEQCLAALRTIDNTARVILSSGHNEADVRALFEAQGASGYIQKPYRMEQLNAVVKETLATN